MRLHLQCTYTHSFMQAAGLERNADGFLVTSARFYSSDFTATQLNAPRRAALLHALTPPSLVHRACLVYGPTAASLYAFRS